MYCLFRVDQPPDQNGTALSIDQYTHDNGHGPGSLDELAAQGSRAGARDSGAEEKWRLEWIVDSGGFPEGEQCP